MWEDIETRAKKSGDYIVKTGCTVRACAEALGSSKSTVHKDVTERLALCDPALAEQVRKILGRNLSERHIRGGESTRKKYASMKRPK